MTAFFLKPAFGYPPRMRQHEGEMKLSPNSFSAFHVIPGQRPTIYIAWAIGPGVRFLLYFKAQRVGNLPSTQTIGFSGFSVMMPIHPGPMARDPIGANHIWKDRLV